ncbi:MAG: EAL domain-containing protein [Acetobacteraceae bacterium]|nr:EAL domain-containing protein [Acetobacteraceae bacterium]
MSLSWPWPDASGGLLAVFALGLAVAALLLALLLRREASRARASLRRAEAAAAEAREADRLLRTVVDAMPAMVTACDADGRVLLVNAAQERFWGLAEGSAEGRLLSELGLPPEIATQLRRAAEARAPAPPLEAEATDAAGRRRALLHLAAPVPDDRPARARTVHVALDITERREADARLRHMAEHDALTGLPNRALFAARLEQAMASGGCALQCFDLDRFKEVNDTHGHAFGDRLLLAVAARVQAVLGPEDLLARLGGAEFAVIQPGAGAAEALRLGRRIVAALAEPFRIGGISVRTAGSVGYVLAPAQASTPERALQHADIAMYAAKGEGGSRAVGFAPVMAEALALRRALEGDLREALDEGAFSVAFQPKYAVADLRLTGFEALARWTHPVRGAVPPALFVPIAEETGLAWRLSRTVALAACRQLAEWASAGRPVPVAVNLSAGHLLTDAAVELVREALAGTGAPAHLLEIEVTESVFLRNAEAAERAVAGLRALGVRVALDDFGAGFSSLSYLLRLPFDSLKIDRTFVSALRGASGLPGGRGAEVVGGIVRLAHGLGARVVAEGVETEEEFAAIRRLACDEVQGHLFGRAMAARLAGALPGRWGRRWPPALREAGD